MVHRKDPDSGVFATIGCLWLCFAAAWMCFLVWVIYTVVKWLTAQEL